LCLDALPRRFASTLCLDALPRRFASTLCLDALPRRFASTLRRQRSVLERACSAPGFGALLWFVAILEREGLRIALASRAHRGVDPVRGALGEERGRKRNAVRAVSEKWAARRVPSPVLPVVGVSVAGQLGPI